MPLVESMAGRVLAKDVQQLDGVKFRRRSLFRTDNRLNRTRQYPRYRKEIVPSYEEAEQQR